METTNPNNVLTRLCLLAAVTLLAACGLTSPVTAATFDFVPASGQYTRECTQTVDIQIDAASTPSNAADAIITYDTTKIEIIDALPAIAGIQILPGNAFESYAGNIVNTTTGEIKLVGYSSVGSLTGTATFATIYFKPKATASAGSFTFTFTGANPYSTLDSNIADAATAYDQLTSVTDGSYSFVTGNCAADTTPPVITFVSPQHLANNVAPNATITIKIADAGSGVSLTSTAIVVNGTTYTSVSPEVSITGSPASYTFTIVPSAPFPTNSPSVISVVAYDTAGNQRNANISINTGYSCPTTSAPAQPAVCPSPSVSPTPTPSPESPVISINSPLTISVKTPYQLVVSASDNDGIALDSFVLEFSGKRFTLTGTPERLSVSGTKNSYTFSITLTPDELLATSEGKIVATIRVTDLEGNSRVQTFVFTAVGIPPKIGTTTNQSSVAKGLLYTLIGVIIGFLLLLIVYHLVLSLQPVLFEIKTTEGRTIRFPRATLLLPNGGRSALYGSITGKVHGRIPHEHASVIVQKYGFAAATVQFIPTVHYTAQKVVLRKL